MKKSKTTLLPGLIMVFLCFNYIHINAQDVTGTWSGTVNLHETVTHTLGHNERRITIFFTNNMGTGTVVEDGEYIVGGKLFCKSSCRGSGNAELHEVTIDKEAATYRIHAISPPYTCTNTGQYCEQPSTDMQELDIIVSERPLDNSPDVLAGSETRVSDLAANGKVTTTITWNLVRTIDIELIVTPQTYDMWLPEPGIDEETQGSVMNILLKVQGKNGRPLLQKAKAFELRLSNTSREPGITLNFPLHPGDPQPDLRFMMQPGADTSEAGQLIRIPCLGGCITGSAKIGSFDGGGWTTLTAIATLEDDTQIKGSLLVPGGKQEIPIPKRDVGSKIGTAWLDVNGNPGEMDDIEESTGNTNNGDGLTAYEEYRGFIAYEEKNGLIIGPKFRRLDPRKKELGVRMKKTEFARFSEGLRWFENATSLIVIRFGETEIDVDRRLNKNALSANSYKQYVLKLENDTINGDASGVNEPITVTAKTPANSERVVIDINKNKQFYQTQVAGLIAANRRYGTNLRMPYTEDEDLANTVAHELAHGVNVNHHGLTSDESSPRTIPPNGVNIYHIYDDNGIEITDRPFQINGSIGTVGNDESGDLSCIMAYTSFYQWAYRYNHQDGSLNYYSVRLLPKGKTLCNSKSGTGINHNNEYFGDATFGNCLSQIKLK